MAIVRASGAHSKRLDDVTICAPEDIAEIRYVARHEREEYENYSNLWRASRLAKQGFLERMRHSEHVRGEPRYYWWRFTVTAKGKAFLEDPVSPSPAGGEKEQAPT